MFLVLYLLRLLRSTAIGHVQYSDDASLLGIVPFLSVVHVLAVARKYYTSK